jgi:ribosome-associated protein
MNDDLVIKAGLIIPGHELEITSSRASGPGGQHVNKSNTKIIVRWNILQSQILTPEQKDLLLRKLKSRITTDGDLLIQNSESRSQIMNKQLAYKHLAQEIKQALIIPKKRKPTKTTQAGKEKRLTKKSQRSEVKKMRSKKIAFD